MSAAKVADSLPRGSLGGRVGSGKGREGKASLSRQTRPVSSSAPECTDSDYFTYYHYLASLLSAPCICRRINHSLTPSLHHSLPQTLTPSYTLSPSPPVPSTTTLMGWEPIKGWIGSNVSYQRCHRDRQTPAECSARIEIMYLGRCENK